MADKKQGESQTEPRGDEVYIRHLTVDEALLKLDKFLNDAFITGYYQVKVVHGKGTGTLRLVVDRYLKKHPLVKSYRLGGYGEGGSGVTIAQLESKIV